MNRAARRRPRRERTSVIAQRLENLSGPEREAIARAVSELRARFPIESLALFGSKARGDDDAESDIDLLVLTSRPVTRNERAALSDLLFDIGLAHDVVFGPLVVHARDWWEGVYQALPIRREVDEQGIAL